MFDEQLASVPANPPRSGVLPGMRLGAAVPRSALLLLLVVLLFFGSFPLLIVSGDPRAKLSLGPSRTAEGRVVGVADVASCRGAGAHHVVYAFRSESGAEFRGASDVCEQSPYYSVQAGEPIEIRYLARDPALNVIAGSEAGGEPPVFVFAIFPLFFLLVLSPLYVPQFRAVMLARRLYRTAALAQGRVVYVKRRSTGTWPGWPGSSSADVYVAYQSLAGEHAETVVGCANDWLVNQLAPGTLVHLLLPSGRAARGVLLEAFIR